MTTDKIINARFSINVVQNLDDEILLLKRSPEAKMGPGLWGFPAGHIKPHESPEECAERELREEIGDDCNVTLLQTYGPVRDSHYGGIYEIHLFHRRWLDGIITLNHEHTDYLWTAVDAVKQYDIMDGIEEDLYYLDIL